MNPSVLRCSFRIPLGHQCLSAGPSRATVALPSRPLPATARRTLTTTRPLSTHPATPTATEPGSTSYTYRTIKALTTRAPSSFPPTILIDVREPAEYAAGHIPTAKNLPIMTRPDAFFLPSDEFRDAFGWEKPVRGGGEGKGEVVFYCKAGIRSRAAAGLAREAGWEGIKEYPGSWVDWVEREKEGEGKGE